MLYTARKEAPDLERGLTPFTVRVPHKAPVYFLIIIIVALQEIQCHSLA